MKKKKKNKNKNKKKKTFIKNSVQIQHIPILRLLSSSNQITRPIHRPAHGSSSMGGNMNHLTLDRQDQEHHEQNTSVGGFHGFFFLSELLFDFLQNASSFKERQRGKKKKKKNWVLLSRPKRAKTTNPRGKKKRKRERKTQFYYT